MGNIVNSSKEAKEDGCYIFVKYKPRRSNPFYVAMVVINSKKFKKNFKSRDDANKWLDKTRKFKIEDFELFKDVYQNAQVF